MRDGNILIAVHTESAEEPALAKDIFDRFAVEDVAAGHAPTPPE